MDTQNFSVKILELTDKVGTKGGKYLFIKTEGGSFSCWQEGLFAVLRAAKLSGEPVGVQVQTKGTFKNIVGVDGVEVPAKSGRGAIGAAMDRKEAAIGKMVDRKENSMREFAIKRDAAMFATAEYAVENEESPSLKELHAKWLMYFEGIY